MESPKILRSCFPLLKHNLRREKWGFGRRYSLLRADDHVGFLEGLRHDFGLMAGEGQHFRKNLTGIPFQTNWAIYIVRLVCHTNPGASAKVLLFVLRVE